MGRRLAAGRERKVALEIGVQLVDALSSDFNSYTAIGSKIHTAIPVFDENQGATVSHTSRRLKV